MKSHQILVVGAALALGIGLLVAFGLLLPGNVEAGPVVSVAGDLSAPESLPVVPQADIIATNTLRIEPAFTTIGSGDVFTVNLVVSDVQDLGGLEYTLEFSPSVVQAARVQLGDFPGSTGRSTMELPLTGDPISNVIGTVSHGFLSFGTLGTGPTGTGIVASVVFTASGSGSSPLSLTKVQVTNTYADVLTPTLVTDGLVVVVEAGVDVCCDSTQSGLPGTLVTHTFTLTNTGDVTDSFTLEITGNAWNTDAPLAVSSLPPDESTTVDVTVDIPHPSLRLAAIVDSDTFTLTATSDYRSTALDTVRGTTNAEVTPGVMLSASMDQAGLPGTNVVYTYTVTNNGNYTDSFALSVSGNTWTTELSIPTSGGLASGVSRTLQATVSIPSSASGGDFDTATVVATSGWNPAITAAAQVTTTVEEEGGFKIHLPVIIRNG